MSWDYADVFNRKERTARKDHWCESGCKIKKGEKYYYFSSLYEGSWSNWKIHPKFQEWLDGINEGLTFDERYSSCDYREADLEIKHWRRLKHLLMSTNARQSAILSVTNRIGRIRESQLHQQIEELEYTIEKQIVAGNRMADILSISCNEPVEEWVSEPEIDAALDLWAKAKAGATK